jgi:hypothetical protein
MREATMAVRTSIYHPYIDPPRDFIRHAALFWDKILTIAPPGCKIYGSKELAALSEAKVIEPIRIDEDHPSVRMASDDLGRYLRSPLGQRMVGKIVQGRDYQYSMHRGKMAPRLKLHLNKLGLSIRKNDWEIMNPELAKFYMTMLAAHLGAENSYADITHEVKANQLALSAKSGEFKRNSGHPHMSREPYEKVLGTLVNVIFQTYRISSRVPIGRILKFRSQHGNLIARFRDSVLDLGKEVHDTHRGGGLQERCTALVVNRVQPSLAELKDELKSNKFSLYDALIDVCILGGGGEILGLDWKGKVLAAGITTSLRAFKFRRDHLDILNKNPYSLLYRLEKGLS